jgi:hypothetical protein
MYRPALRLVTRLALSFIIHDLDNVFYRGFQKIIPGNQSLSYYIGSLEIYSNQNASGPGACVNAQRILMLYRDAMDVPESNEEGIRLYINQYFITDGIEDPLMEILQTAAVIEVAENRHVALMGKEEFCRILKIDGDESSLDKGTLFNACFNATLNPVVLRLPKEQRISLLLRAESIMNIMKG